MTEKDNRYFVYALRCEKYMKVGYTQNPESRRNALSSATPYTLKEIFVQEFPEKPSALAFERMAHDLLKELGLHHEGEWYLYRNAGIKELNKLGEKYSFSTIVFYSKVQDGLLDLVKIINKNKTKFPVRRCVNHLKKKNLPIAAEFVESAASGNLRQPLKFPEIGSEDVLLEYLANVEISNPDKLTK